MVSHARRSERSADIQFHASLPKPSVEIGVDGKHKRDLTRPWLLAGKKFQRIRGQWSGSSAGTNVGTKVLRLGSTCADACLQRAGATSMPCVHPPPQHMASSWHAMERPRCTWEQRKVTLGSRLRFLPIRGVFRDPNLRALGTLNENICFLKNLRLRGSKSNHLL